MSPLLTVRNIVIGLGWRFRLYLRLHSTIALEGFWKKFYETLLHTALSTLSIVFNLAAFYTTHGSLGTAGVGPNII